MWGKQRVRGKVEGRNYVQGYADVIVRLWGGLELEMLDKVDGSGRCDKRDASIKRIVVLFCHGFHICTSWI